MILNDLFEVISSHCSCTGCSSCLSFSYTHSTVGSVTVSTMANPYPVSTIVHVNQVCVCVTTNCSTGSCVDSIVVVDALSTCTVHVECYTACTVAYSELNHYKGTDRKLEVLIGTDCYNLSCCSSCCCTNAVVHLHTTGHCVLEIVSVVIRKLDLRNISHKNVPPF